MLIKRLSSIILLLVIFCCNVKSQTVHAKDFQDALCKIQKKQYGKSSYYDYQCYVRRCMLSFHGWDWNYDKEHEDTLYVCDVSCISSYDDEYIITSKHIYSILSLPGRYMKCDVIPYEKYKVYEVDCVRNWDVDLFNKKRPHVNDCDYVDAYRIIKVSKHKYHYENYTFQNPAIWEKDSVLNKYSNYSTPTKLE